jgi:hypothetical protein
MLRWSINRLSPARRIVIESQLLSVSWNLENGQAGGDTAGGFTIRQNADNEGTALFDPADEQQARLALATAKVRKRPVTTPAQRQAMAERLQINASPTNKGVSAPNPDNRAPVDPMLTLTSVPDLQDSRRDGRSYSSSSHRHSSENAGDCGKQRADYLSNSVEWHRRLNPRIAEVLQ